jgi:hypothetical protein
MVEVFEMCVIPRTMEMDAAEEQLRNSLVAFVRGSQLVASPEQVSAHLLRHFEVGANKV